MIGLLAALIVAGVLVFTIKLTRTVPVNDRQPSPVARLAAWEQRMGEHRAEERRRQYRAQVAFDERATVQVRVVPKLPK